MSYTAQASAQDRRNALMERILLKKFNAMESGMNILLLYHALKPYVHNKYYHFLTRIRENEKCGKKTKSKA